jgi:hypothetical protein
MALVSTTLLLLNNYMIYHSLFIWTSNYLPLFGVLTIYLVYLLIKDKNSLWPVFLLGLVGGVAFGIQYFYLFTLGITFLVCIYFSRKKLLAVALFISGAVVGELPTVIFDLKHGFYHVRTLWMYFMDNLSQTSKSQLSYYHLLNFWPVAAMILGYFLVKYVHRSWLIGLAVGVYVYFNLTSSIISFTKPIGMEEGLNWFKINQAANQIAKDNPINFNVVSLVDFDTRGHILRYPLQFIYGKTPMGVEEYPQAKTLYVLVKGEYDFESPKVWEMSSFQPYSFEILNQIDNNYAVYKLTKK